jgi:hypothetical protein
LSLDWILGLNRFKKGVLILRGAFFLFLPFIRVDKYSKRGLTPTLSNSAASKKLINAFWRSTPKRIWGIVIGGTEKSEKAGE